MITTIICLNEQKELELVAVGRIGYSPTKKRFWFEKIGCADVFYYNGIGAELASTTIKAALNASNISLTDFGGYAIKRGGFASDLASQSCPKQKNANTDQGAVAERTVGEKASVAKRTPAKNAFMTKMSRFLGNEAKRVRGFAQAIAVAAAEEEVKDKERSAARKADWDAKMEKLESKVRERRARRASEKDSNGEDENDDAIRSEFEEISSGVAAAAEAMTEGDVSTAQSTHPDIGIETEVATIMSSESSSSADGDTLKEITQLNLDFITDGEVEEDLM